MLKLMLCKHSTSLLIRKRAWFWLKMCCKESKGQFLMLFNGTDTLFDNRTQRTNQPIRISVKQGERKAKGRICQCFQCSLETMRLLTICFSAKMLPDKLKHQWISSNRRENTGQFWAFQDSRRNILSQQCRTFRCIKLRQRVYRFAIADSIGNFW